MHGNGRLDRQQRLFNVFYRVPGFLAVVWIGNLPFPLTPLSRYQVVSFSQSTVLPVQLTVGSGGEERSKIIRRRASLVLYNPLTTLWWGECTYVLRTVSGKIDSKEDSSHLEIPRTKWNLMRLEMNISLTISMQFQQENCIDFEEKHLGIGHPKILLFYICFFARLNLLWEWHVQETLSDAIFKPFFHFSN